MSKLNFSIVCASNDQETFERNLQQSLICKNASDLIIEENAKSASTAYNSGLKKCSEDIVIFAHQDVYFPPFWQNKLANAVSLIEQEDKNWAVIAPYGISASGRGYGPVWSSSLGSIVGAVSPKPIKIRNADELVIILRQSSGIKFDDNMPSWHLYGTDIIMESLNNNKNCYNYSLPLIHNDKFHEYFGDDFVESYKYISNKWQKELPIISPVISINKYRLSILRKRMKMKKSLTYRRAMAVSNLIDPKIYSRLCGWE